MFNSIVNFSLKDPQWFEIKFCNALECKEKLEIDAKLK